MVTPQEADALAQECIRNYLNDCGLETVADAGNALMKLCSVTGIALCATVGYEDAVDRLNGVAAFVENNMRDVQFKREMLN
jgi:hypothetical protein